VYSSFNSKIEATVNYVCSVLESGATSNHLEKRNSAKSVIY